jgi:DNA helicase-2/ATP-dependent DNA helicase PcrA
MQPDERLGEKELSEVQRQACRWNDGAFLLLAGPGSGKTTVLTERVIRLLEESANESFKILALTFTNRAADEMRARIERVYSDDRGRLLVGTFHSFAAEVLRQSGQQLGLHADFKIYSRDEDRADVLRESCSGLDEETTDALEDIKLLPIFDRAASLLLTGSRLEARITNKERAPYIARAYDAYHEYMLKENVQDFPSLVLNAYRLFDKYPALGKRYRQTFRFWTVDEFQDTTYAQFQLLKVMAAQEFKNIFAVADDDQLIFQWNGASYERLQEYITAFKPTTLQLPTNYRCPQEIVELANRLIANNRLRQPGKAPLISGKSDDGSAVPRVRLLDFPDEEAEARGIAVSIKLLSPGPLNKTTVLARARRSLELVQNALQDNGVRCRIIQRRSEFQTLEFRWLHYALLLASKRADSKTAEIMVGLFNALSGIKVVAQDVIAEANARGGDYLKVWVEATAREAKDNRSKHLAATVRSKLIDTQDYRAFADAVISAFESGSDASGAFSEDSEAWRSLVREIRQAAGSRVSLDLFLQELELRSKEPPPKDDEIALMTIHSAKGTEFTHVYVVGLAEDILPAYQSLQKGDASPEMEEERRNCFVAITRTRKTLTLSYAQRYRGYRKEPSRFLREMGVIK